MTAAVPIWRITRTRPARRLYDALASAGLRVSVLDCFRRDLAGDEPVTSTGSPPATIEATPAADRPDRWAISDPGLERDHLVLGALAEGDLVGGALLSTGGPVYVPELGRTVAFEGGYVWGLWVEPDWRRRGIASKLLSEALVRLDDCGAPAATALVAPDNHPSRALFCKSGFAPERRHVYVNAFGLERRSSRIRGGE